MAINNFFDKLKTIKRAKSKINFIVSPNKLDVLFLRKKGGLWKIIEKQEFSGPLIFKDEINIDFIKKVLIQLDIKNTEVGISLNTPFFFTNLIRIPDIDGDVKNALNIKIQTEFPLPLDKYFWSFQEIPSPDTYKTFLVFFYYKDVLEAVNEAFAINGILPVVIEPAILSILRYLKEKFTLEIEKTYFMVVLYASVLTGFIYENGIVKNTFSESIAKDTNINQSLEKFVQFSLQKYSVERIKQEVAGLIIVSDEEISTGSYFEVIKLCDILKTTPDAVIGIGLNQRMIKAPIADNEILLNTYNPTTEFLYLKFSRYLNFWSVLVFGVSVLSILSVYTYIVDLSLTNADLKGDAIASRTDISRYKNDLKDILFMIKKIDASKHIPAEIFPKINELDKIIKIQDARITNKTLTISGIVLLKNLEKLKDSILQIDSNAQIQEIRATGNEIEVKIILGL